MQFLQLRHKLTYVSPVAFGDCFGNSLNEATSLGSFGPIDSKMSEGPEEEIELHVMATLDLSDIR